MLAINAFHHEILWLDIGPVNNSTTGFWGGKFYRPQYTIQFRWYRKPEMFFGAERCE